jgi:hypothetical protein
VCHIINNDNVELQVPFLKDGVFFITSESTSCMYGEIFTLFM